MKENTLQQAVETRVCGSGKEKMQKKNTIKSLNTIVRLY
jgi:hypothetical protein